MYLRCTRFRSLLAEPVSDSQTDGDAQPNVLSAGMRRILSLLPREERWRTRLVCRAMRAAVHGMPDLAFWLALTAGPLSGVIVAASFAFDS